MFPEENIFSGNWSKDDSIYYKWKEIERYTIEKSSYSVVVSKPMIRLTGKDYDSDKVKYIPIGFDSEKFVANTSSRDRIRADLEVQDKKVIVYSGSLQLNFWNDLGIYSEFFNKINLIMDNVHFLILTNSDHDQIIDFFDDKGIVNYSILSIDPTDIALYLSAADAGIQVMYEMEDSETRFGVKVVEYWASGLPVITNRNVGGLCSLIKDDQYLGLIVDSEADLKNIGLYLNNIKL